MNQIRQEDILSFCASFALGEELRRRTFLITGATGLIGSTLVHCLLHLDKDIKIFAPVRNEEKAKEIFDEMELNNIQLIKCDLLTFDYLRVTNVDYIVHCAAPTASKYFVEYPVETAQIIYQSTSRLLEYAKSYPPKAMVYLSSLEVYGSIVDDTLPITEDLQGFLNPLDVRSSYPMAKRAAENLCYLYAKEYKLNISIARLTQTTGVGVTKDDNRIISQFSRLVAHGEDIILYTKGDSARPYCYITDCISAILYVLLKGKSGEAYNVANENTYISAKGMAEYLQRNFNPNIHIKVELNDKMGYAPTTMQRLDTSKLKALGWKPMYGLKEIFTKLIDYINS